MRGWYNTTGKDQSCKVISARGALGGGMTGPLMTIAEAIKLCAELTDGTQNYIVKGVISLIRKDNALYKSCPTEGCKKKVVDMGNEMWKCEKCNREFPNFKYRILTNVSNNH